MFESGLVSALLAFGLGGLTGQKWVGSENLINALLLGVSTELGLKVNELIGEGYTFLGDTRFSAGVYTGLLYTAGYSIASHSVAGIDNYSIFGDFAYGFGLSFATYFIFARTSAPGLFETYRKTKKSERKAAISSDEAKLKADLAAAEDKVKHKNSFDFKSILPYLGRF